ncbi:protein zyg-11 homolog B-like [Stegodyphus dumicola]|uniref:protein zyg-11 homolog B-like n=1 Tax=Stegodyphus dumicola TaxID=202533 RepID=UPI0015AEDCEE|nr:protein zyg-11 homolog B-like [Stegodyphus dumicola]
MWDSPEALQDICVEYISRNINLVFNAVLDVNGNTLKYLFKNSLLRFPCSVSEQLFSALNDIGLTDQLLTIFDPSVTRLNRVYIGEDSKISVKGLRVLRFHKISELSAVGLNNIAISELVGCLSDWTLENLFLLNVSNSTFLSSEKVRIFIALSKLKNLICLDVSFTEFNSQGLEIVAEDLRCLENLNISGTKVIDISPLKKCKDRLKFLSMYNLKISHTSTFMPVLQKLHKLQHLDISDDKDEPYELASVNMSAFSEFLKDPTCLPSLISLDITGKNGVDADTLKAFLSNHPQMRFLGLLETEACQDDFFCEISDPVFKHKLVQLWLLLWEGEVCWLVGVVSFKRSNGSPAWKSQLLTVPQSFHYTALSGKEILPSFAELQVLMDK